MTQPALSQEWIAQQMRDAGTSWSVGTFGAIAEFARDPDEPARFEANRERSEVVTSRGGVRIGGLTGARAVAYETTNKDLALWSHAIALCLPIDACLMNRRTTLTEIGLDAEALRESDREGILFDLGLGALQIDVCVRTSDPELLLRLREGLGRSVFDHANPAMPAILRASPHRVFVARLGRGEVYQAIPAPDQKSPDGPHTHVLPKLLKARRTHSAANPIPEGWVPCAHLYPANPIKDEMGRPRRFEAALHETFQGSLAAFGDPELVRLKRAVAEGVRVGRHPATLAAPQNRFATAAKRVALRQILATDGVSASLRAWQEHHDRIADDSPEEDEQATHR